MQLGFPQIGPLAAQLPDPGNQPWVCLGSSPMLGCAGFARQHRRVPAAFRQDLLPAVESATRYGKGVLRCRQTMFFPELQDVQSSLGIFVRVHPQTITKFPYPVEPPDSVPHPLHLHNTPPSP